MPSSSPYQINDYQAANSYRPYQLPINSIFKAISAQDQFWNEGAARVKNVYDNALGMSLTLNENKALEHFYFTMTILKQSDVLKQ